MTGWADLCIRKFGAPVKVTSAETPEGREGRGIISPITPRDLNDKARVSAAGVYDRERKKTTILHRENNRDWQPGSGLFTIHAVKGTKALLAQGGQLRGDFKLGLKYLLLDVAGGGSIHLDLKGDLARFGRDCGEIYLVDRDGTLLFVTQPLSADGDSRPRRKDIDASEIWVRTAGGDYQQVALSGEGQQLLIEVLIRNG